MDATTSQPVATGGSSDLLFADSFEQVNIDPPPETARVLERLTYGARPGDITDFESLGGDTAARLSAYLDAQLEPASIDDTDCDQRLAAAGYTTLDKGLDQLWAEHVRGEGPDLSGWPERYYPCAESECARIVRATYSRRQVYERMVEFWHDHFSVYGWEFSIAPVFAHYDRDVIRPYALGNFRAMLEAVARSTAMLVYLDNASNRSGGFNENWAREMMELHTLGVENYYPGVPPDGVPVGSDGLGVGYTDYDVYALAECFTGWTYRNDHWQFPDAPEFDTGEFLYWEGWHEPNEKYFLQNWLPKGGENEARQAMDMACMHTATARRIAGKLCRRFISDDPPQALIDSAADVFHQHWQSPDQIARVVRHIVTAPEFLDVSAGKMRRPYDLFAAALRKTDAEISPEPYSDWMPYGQMFSRLDQTGHRPFAWKAPDGYPDFSAAWSSVSVLGQSWRLLSRLPELTVTDTDDYLLPVVDLTVQDIPGPQRSAANMVDYWLDRLLGHHPAPARRQELIDFLRQNAAADVAIDITSDPPHGGWSSGDLSDHYNQARLRATVGLMFTLPEFHLR